MSNLEGDFPTAMRGYDKGAVDDAIRDLRKELLTLSAQNSQLATELRETTAKLNEALQHIKEVGEPSYAGVGAKAALILSTSEEMSSRLLAEATAERPVHPLSHRILALVVHLDDRRDDLLLDQDVADPALAQVGLLDGRRGELFL